MYKRGLDCLKGKGSKGVSERKEERKRKGVRRKGKGRKGVKGSERGQGRKGVRMLVSCIKEA